MARSLGIGAAGLVAAGLAIATGTETPPAAMATLGHFAMPTPPTLQVPRLEPLGITDEMRRKGVHECFPPDPLGLGPYRPYRNVRHGRLAVPQKGGHTDEHAFDVIVHFHGADAFRKTLVQVARGIAFVGVDKGLGSGPYASAFAVPGELARLRDSITGALREETGDPRARIRRFGLSAWSAGYGAVNEILKHGEEGVDAVILLDGLHAAWKPGIKRSRTLQSATDATVKPTFEFARRAMVGDKTFVLTHSDIVPEEYPSTRQTADLLLAFLGLVRDERETGSERFPRWGLVERKGLHLWSHRGSDAMAHCDHLRHAADALRVVETAWKTPPMDRDVPPTPAPKLGGGSSPEQGPLVLGAPEGMVDAPGASGHEEDHGGLEPVPLSPPAARPEPGEAPGGP